MVDARRACEPVTRWLRANNIDHDPPAQCGRGHIKLHLRYRDQQRYVVISASASDKRAIANQIRDCKRELRRMGWDDKVD